MKALVIYDSLYGNTEKIAKAVGEGTGGKVKFVGEVRPSELKGLDLLIIGSPTHGGQPKPTTTEFLDKIPENSLKGVSVAAFDTRFEKSGHGIGLRLLMAVINFAAPRIADTLKKKGGVLVAEPEGFFVEGKEGPLKEGELERAKTWAKGILESTK
ncbi:MAG TPA: flavodoxin family protein [Candidatus Nanoarchaeia archaeon]